MKTNNSFLVQREWVVSARILSCLHFMKCGSLCLWVLDVLNGQTFVEMLDWLLCLAQSGSGRPRCSWYKQEAGFSTSLATRKHVFAVRWPAAAVNAKCYTKRSHEIAPAAPSGSRRTVFFLNGPTYYLLSTADPGKENGELIVTKKNKRLGT